jgi:hypothetical protein
MPEPDLYRPLIGTTAPHGGMTVRFVSGGISLAVCKDPTP